LPELLLDARLHHRVDGHQRHHRRDVGADPGAHPQHQGAGSAADVPRAAHPAVGDAELHHRAHLEGHVPPPVRRHPPCAADVRDPGAELVRPPVHVVPDGAGDERVAELSVHDGGVARRAAVDPRRHLRGGARRRRQPLAGVQGDHPAVAAARARAGGDHLGGVDVQHVQHHLPGHRRRARRGDRDPGDAGVQVRVRALPLRLRGGLLDGDLRDPAHLWIHPEPRLQGDGGLTMARSRREEQIPHGPLHLILVVATLVTMYPVLWVITIAFSGKQSLAIADLPPDPSFFDRLRAVIPWPQHWSFSNFVPVMTDQPFGRWLLNSIIVAALTTLVGVFLSCTAAYAFSRFKFPGRRLGMMSFLVSQMFPGTLMLIPLYIIIVQVLGLGSTKIGLVIVYATTSIPFSVWMLKGYFDTIPKELEEAALIEGASAGQIFWRIVLPLAKPAVAITALFSFMSSWNEFI